MTDEARAIRAHLPVWQLFKFGTVGLSNTLVDLLLFVLFYNVLHLNYIIAHLISYGCATMNSFLLNKYFTFQRKAQFVGREVYRFVVLNACSFLLSLGLIYGLNHLLHLPVLYSKLLSIVFTVFVNYFGSKYWCFVEK